MTASRKNIQVSRGKNSSLQLQRIRRPPGLTEAYGNLSIDEGSCRSVVFHQSGADDDMSQYQYSIDPSHYRIDNDDEDCLATPEEADNQTIDEESLYTSSQRRKDWGAVREQSAQEERKRKMIAGQDNSIPKMITGVKNIKHDSKRNLRSYSSTGSMFSFDPTEEESYESTEQETTERGGMASSGRENTVTATLDSELQLVKKKGGSRKEEGNKKHNLMKRIWKAVLFGSSHNKKEARRNISSRGKQLARQSAPVRRYSPQELWDQERKHSSRPASARRHRQSVKKSRLSPHYLNALWSPEQAQARGMPLAKLRVSTNGVRVWENASFRIIPFTGAEC